MFESNFAEGNTLAAASSANGETTSQTPVISLPADNSSTLRLFANIAHHKLNLVPETLEPEVLHNMAIFIDKYNCQVALADRGRMWLRAFEDQKRLSVEDCWRGLLFTYAMDYGKEFSTLSGVLMEFGPWGSGYCESFHSWKYALDNMAFLPFDVLDHLGMQRDGTKRKIHAALMDAVVKLTTRRSTIPWDDTMNNRSSCNRLAMAIATYTHTLLKLGILPGVPNEGTHTHMSPGQLIQMIEETEFPESPFKERESAVDGLGYGRPSAHVQGTKTLI